MLRKIVSLLCTVSIIIGCCYAIPVFAEEEKILAFPGAEGGGKYTLGARAVEKPEVYHVTNLNDKGYGSLRDAVSKSNRIIVFDIGGTISTEKDIYIKGSNLTILGQTAPGDGITVEGGAIGGYGTGNSLIMRYLKIRPGDRLGKEVDGISILYASDIIVDHCSVSWAIDEQVSVLAGNSEDTKYVRGKNITVQNCIISEGLNLSNHSKGEHSYGSIFGGDNSTLYHNIYAHNKSRNPALYAEIQNVNVANNVIYNWGITPAYGGEPNANGQGRASSINYVNNFFKVGQNSLKWARKMFYEIVNYSPDKIKSSFYFGGNVFENEDEITNDNLKGVESIDKAIILDKPIDLGEYEVPKETAYETYNKIFDTIGASIPKRDAIDAKVIADVKNGTGHIINAPEEVGGYINDPIYRPFYIPDSWKKANGMGEEAQENDLVPDGIYKGYTWIEAYVFDLEKEAAKPTNPDVVIQSPAIESNTDTVMGIKVDNGAWKVITEGESFNFKASAIPKPDTEIDKIELYDEDVLIDTFKNTETVSTNIFPKAGTHYYTVRAYNNKGEAANSTTAIVFVNPVGELPDGLYYKELGTTLYNGNGKASCDENGIYTVGGAGRIKSTTTCGFMYRPVKGDFSISVKVEDIPVNEQRIRSGVLITDRLDDRSRVVMLSDHFEKFGENIFVITKTEERENESQNYMRDKDGNEISNENADYVNKPDKYRVPKYLKAERRGDTITLSVSDDGTDWTNNTRQPYEVTIDNLPETLYVGLGVESNQGPYPKMRYSMAKFSGFDIKEYEKLTPVNRWEAGAVNGNKITVINNIRDDEITPDGEKINVYAALYETSEELGKRLKQCSVGSFVTNKYNNLYEITLENEINKQEDDELRVFLWDDALSPVNDK